MRIEVKGRNLPVSDDLKEQVVKRFRLVAKQVSEFAHLELEVYEERNPAIAESKVAEATLHLKGATLRARSASRDLRNAVIDVSDEIAVQVKRHLDKRRGRRPARAAAAAAAAAPPLETNEAPGADDVSPAA
ncbi:MAG: HPF/RaiA family ribosome-associated protein [Solirubrobacteraceae bacterium]|jgi:putative sigma-54 modulation protein